MTTDRSLKVVSAALSVINGEIWSDVMQGFTDADIYAVADTLLEYGHEDLADAVHDCVF